MTPWRRTIGGTVILERVLGRALFKKRENIKRKKAGSAIHSTRVVPPAKTVGGEHLGGQDPTSVKPVGLRVGRGKRDRQDRTFT